MSDVDFMCSHCGDEHQIPMPDCAHCPTREAQMRDMHVERVELKAEIKRLGERLAELEGQDNG
jgi:hypothetical protein